MAGSLTTKTIFKIPSRGENAILLAHILSSTCTEGTCFSTLLLIDDQLVIYTWLNPNKFYSNLIAQGIIVKLYCSGLNTSKLIKLGLKNQQLLNVLNRVWNMYRKFYKSYSLYHEVKSNLNTFETRKGQSSYHIRIESCKYLRI